MTGLPAGLVVLTTDQVFALMLSAATQALIDAEKAKHDTVTAAEAAKLIRCQRGDILAACESGALPAKRHGNRWKIRSTDLQAWDGAGRPIAKATS